LAARSSRIRFLWNALSVPTSGNSPVKRGRAANMKLSADFTGNVPAGGQAATHRAAPYYCIARGDELWFERLDFDAF